MSTHKRGAFAASFRAARASYSFPIITAFITALLLIGCTATRNEIVSRVDPSDPSAPVTPVTYRSTIGSYESLRPTKPTAWRQQNERAAPQQKPEQ